MLSALKLPSIEARVEEDEVEEEEVDGLDLQKIEPVTIMNNQSTQNTLTTLKVKGEETRDGQISPMFNVTTARSMGTMNVNAERSKHTRTITKTIAEPMSPKKKRARPK